MNSFNACICFFRYIMVQHSKYQHLLHLNIQHSLCLVSLRFPALFSLGSLLIELVVVQQCLHRPSLEVAFALEQPSFHKVTRWHNSITIIIITRLTTIFLNIIIHLMCLCRSSVASWSHANDVKISNLSCIRCNVHVCRRTISNCYSRFCSWLCSNFISSWPRSITIYTIFGLLFLLPCLVRD